MDERGWIKIRIRRLFEFILFFVLVITGGFYGFKYYIAIKIYKEPAEKATQQNQMIGNFLNEVNQVKSMAELDIVLVKYGVKPQVIPKD